MPQIYKPKQIFFQDGVFIHTINVTEIFFKELKL